MGDVAVLDDVGDLLGHLPPEVGEVEARAPAVEHAVGVVHLAVAQQVDDRVVVRLIAVVPAVAAAAGPARRPGRASSTVCTARSSWAADRNHASYADGGRWTPASSMAWKNARERRGVLARRRPSKSRTGSSVKNTENIVPVGLDDVRHAGRGQRLGGRGLDRLAGGGEVGVDARRWPAAAWSARRWWRSGSRTACRPGRPAPRARAATSRRPGRRTPRPGSRRPSPCRRSSGRAASPRPRRRGPTGPCREARKPVITSSLTNSAPWRGAGLGEERVEARLGRDHAHVAGGRLGDQAGDPVAVLGERLLDRGPVVVGQHERQRGRRLRDAGGAGHRERGEAGARPRPAARRRGRGSSRRTSRPRRGR